MRPDSHRERLLRIMSLGPVIPVVTLADASQALPLARALLAGSVKVIEMTLRTQAGLFAIETIAREMPDVEIGAGTVLDDRQMAAVASAGARFAVSPINPTPLSPNSTTGPCASLRVLHPCKAAEGGDALDGSAFWSTVARKWTDRGQAENRRSPAQELTGAYYHAFTNGSIRQKS